MRRLLVRADDFGFSEGVNQGVARTVYQGIIRNVGLMPNMAAAAQGVELLRDAAVCWGQHTNICVGKPITDPEQIPSLVNQRGEFKTATEYRNAGRDIVDLEEAILEIEAQYQRFVELTGVQPSYFEGHAIFNANFLKALRTVADRHGLPYLESLPGMRSRFRNTALVGVMDSMKPDYDPHDTLKRAALMNLGENSCAMLICHPGFLDDYLLEHGLLVEPRPKEVEMLCDSAVAAWLKEQNIQLVTYDEL